VLFLLATALIVFALGYRFYAKLLALALFRPNADYSTPAILDEKGRPAPPCRKPVLFGHHVVAISAGTTLIGTTLAAFWGWIPAFLWLVTGTVVAAGTYGFGALWLSATFPNRGLEAITGKLFGSGMRELTLILTTIVLLLISAVFVWLATEVLAAYPAAVLGFWIQVPLALALGAFWHRQGQENLILTSVGILFVAVILIAMLGGTGFGFSGALNINVGDSPMISVDARFIWAILIIVLVYHGLRLPVDKLVRPRAYLTALQVGLFLLWFLLGALISAPAITAPEFHGTPGAPGIMPWLFITLVSGALAGFHMLIAHGITGPAMDQASDARNLGYGGALVDGVLAITALVISITAFKNRTDWENFYQSWQGIQDLPKILNLYIEGFGQFTAHIGLGEHLSTNLAAIVILGLLTCALDATMAVLKQNIQKVTQPINFSRVNKKKFVLFLTTLMLTIIIFLDGKGAGGRVLWPLWGITNHVLAFVMFIVLSLIVHQRQQLWQPLLLPIAFLIVITTWAWVIILPIWWENGNWPALLTGLLLLLIELVVATKTAQALYLLINKHRQA